MDKVCVKCKIEFKSKSVSQIYCKSCRSELICCMDKCNNKVSCVSKLLCSKHYAQEKRKGNVCVLICRGCGKEFKNTSNSGRFYYCEECKNKKCKKCDKLVFYQKWQLCKNCFQQEKREGSKNKYNKSCKVCNKHFTTTYPYKKFCSHDCKIRNDIIISNIKEKKRKRSKKGLYPRNCFICNNIFTPKRLCDENQKCCSVLCRIEYTRKKQAERYMENDKKNHLGRGQSFPQKFVYDVIKKHWNNFTWTYDNRQVIKNPNTNRGMELDIWCPDLKFAIEFDGQHHFKPKFGEEMFKKTQIWDKIKNEVCIKSNIRLLRISYKDNWKDKDWVIKRVEEFLNDNC